MIHREKDFLKIGLILLIVVLAMRLIFSLYLFKAVNGYSLFDGDSCSRILNAWKWAKSPTLRPVVDDWLNLHFWIVGLGLKIYPDTVFIPMMISTIFSLGSLVILFMLSVELFSRNIAVGILTSGLVAFHPFLIWLSLSGLPAHIFYFFILVGIFFWIKYIKERKNSSLFFATTAFLLSTGVRYEAWVFTFIFCCFVLRELIVYFRKRRVFNWFLFSSILLAWGFVFYWLFAQKIYYGNPFHFLFYQYNAVVSEAAIKGMSTIEILRNYIIHSIGFFPWPVTLVAVLGMMHMLRAKRAERAVSDLILFIFLQYILLMSVYPFGLGGPWIEKSTVITSLLFLPFCAFVICGVIGTRRQQAQVVFASLLVGIFIWVNVAQNAYNPRYNLPCGMEARKYARQCGMLLRSLYRTKALQATEKVLLEQPLTGPSPNIWDGFFIRVIAPDHIVWDRDEKYRFKNGQVYLSTENNPSKFDPPVIVLDNFFKKENIKVAIAVSEQVNIKLTEIMDKILTIGRYNLYIRRGDRDLAIDMKRRFAKVKTDWYDEWWTSNTFRIRNF